MVEEQPPEEQEEQREPKPPLPPDIEEMHRSVVAKGEETYEDPATGYTVFTELVHK